jgi:uncharacterized protein (TIGR00252 family)
MSTTHIGREAENAAANWLEMNGFTVIDTNWRTRWCEIDIIARKGAVIFFVEVRYRKSDAWGDGFDSITPKKYKQMEFAAQFWLSSNNWSNDARIAAMAVSGVTPTVTKFSEL